MSSPEGFPVIEFVPKKPLQRKKYSNGKVEVLMQWKDLDESLCTWEPAASVNVGAEIELPEAVASDVEDDTPEGEDCDEDVFMIEKLCFVFTHPQTKETRAFIKWAHYSARDATWEPIGHIRDRDGMKEELEQAEKRSSKMFRLKQRKISKPRKQTGSPRRGPFGSPSGRSDLTEKTKSRRRRIPRVSSDSEVDGNSTFPKLLPDKSFEGRAVGEKVLPTNNDLSIINQPSTISKPPPTQNKQLLLSPTTIPRISARQTPPREIRENGQIRENGEIRENGQIRENGEIRENGQTRENGEIRENSEMFSGSSDPTQARKKRRIESPRNVPSETPPYLVDICSQMGSMSREYGGSEHTIQEILGPSMPAEDPDVLYALNLLVQELQIYMTHHGDSYSNMASKIIVLRDHVQRYQKELAEAKAAQMASGTQSDKVSVQARPPQASVQPSVQSVELPPAQTAQAAKPTQPAPPAQPVQPVQSVQAKPKPADIPLNIPLDSNPIRPVAPPIESPTVRSLLTATSASSAVSPIIPPKPLPGNQKVPTDSTSERTTVAKPSASTTISGVSDAVERATRQSIPSSRSAQPAPPGSTTRPDTTTLPAAELQAAARNQQARTADERRRLELVREDLESRSHPVEAQAAIRSQLEDLQRSNPGERSLSAQMSALDRQLGTGRNQDSRISDSRDSRQVGHRPEGSPSATNRVVTPPTSFEAFNSTQSHTNRYSGQPVQKPSGSNTPVAFSPTPRPYPRPVQPEHQFVRLDPSPAQQHNGRWTPGHASPNPHGPPQQVSFHQTQASQRRNPQPIPQNYSHTLPQMPSPPQPQAFPSRPMGFPSRFPTPMPMPQTILPVIPARPAAPPRWDLQIGRFSVKESQIWSELRRLSYLCGKEIFKEKHTLRSMSTKMRCYCDTVEEPPKQAWTRVWSLLRETKIASILEDGIRCAVCSYRDHAQCSFSWATSLPVDNALATNELTTYVESYVCIPCRCILVEPLASVDKILKLQTIAGPACPAGTLDTRKTKSLSFEFTLSSLEYRSLHDNKTKLQVRGFLVKPSTYRYAGFPSQVTFSVNQSSGASPSAEYIIKPPAVHRKRKELPWDVPARDIRPATGNRIQITCQYTDSQLTSCYMFALVLVKPVPAETVLAAVKASSALTLTESKNACQAVFEEASRITEDEVQLESIDCASVSLRCPSTLMRIGIPARGFYCRHNQCFDLEFYVTSQPNFSSHQHRWKCPVCNKHCLPHELMIDSWQQQILQQTNEGEPRVTLLFGASVEYAVPERDEGQENEILEAVVKTDEQKQTKDPQKQTRDQVMIDLD